MGNEVDLWEMAQICVEMAELIEKRFKKMENDLEIREISKIFGKLLRFMGQGLSI